MNALARCIVLVLLCVVPLCGGCAFGQKYNYHDVVPRLDATGSGQLVVMTHDQRPYVVSGETPPDFVGLLRSGFGIPYPVYTQGDRPLAEEMTYVTCNALTKQGFQCVPVPVAASAKPNEIRRKLQEHAGMSAVFLELHEWKSDTHTDTALAYDVTLRILDPHGTPTAETHIQGRDVLGGSFWNPLSFAHTAVPQALQKNLEELLNAPMIITALQTGKRPSSVPQQQERKATVDLVQLQPHYDAFRLFLQPHTDAERLGSVSAGVPLKVIEDRDQWLYIETPDGKRGWILREWIQQ